MLERVLYEAHTEPIFSEAEVGWQSALLLHIETYLL